MAANISRRADAVRADELRAARAGDAGAGEVAVAEHQYVVVPHLVQRFEQFGAENGRNTFEHSHRSFICIWRMRHACIIPHNFAFRESGGAREKGEMP